MPSLPVGRRQPARSRRSRPSQQPSAWKPRPGVDGDGRCSRPQRAARAGAALAIAALLLVGAQVLLGTGRLAQAQEAGAGLVVGGAAAIANAGGDSVLLRDGPGYDAAALDALGEGTPLTVTDGPITAADGSRWFGVDVGDRAGYVVADFLAPTLAPPAAPSPAALAPAAQASAPSTTLVAAQPVPSAADAGGTAVAREAVNLRAEPRPDAPVLTVVPAGAALERTGDASGDFLPVAYGGQTGYAAIAYLTLGAAPAAAPPAPAAAAAAPAPPVPAAAPGNATTTDSVNLRAGPSTGDAVLRVLPAGSAVAPTGEASGGFLGVTFEGTPGWIDAAFIASAAPTAAPATAASEQPAAPAPAATTPTAPAATPPAPPALDLGAAPTGRAATANDLVNLRAGPGAAEEVLRVLPPGSGLTVTGGASNGFLPVWYNGTEGWIVAQYVDDGAAAGDDPPDLTAPAAPEVAPATGGGLIWPVTGGTWEVMQGYNGSSHQNNSGTWQYYYSLDLVREDGGTAGQPVVSPANGTVRWLDPSTGGISIDIGDGHAVALFHVAVDGSIEEGDAVSQGQYLGTISGAGGPGFAGTPHVHFALWETGDGGNWSRTAAPFVGPYAISGMAFPDTGGGNQHRGTTFTP